MEEINKIIPKYQELIRKNTAKHVEIVDGEIVNIEPLVDYRARKMREKQNSVKKI